MRWLVVAMALVCGVAQAASFDCAAAKTVREHAICRDPKLSKADEALSQAFANTRSQASEPYRAALLAQQRQWLRLTDLTCTSGRTDPAAEDLRACLANDITNRIRFLRERAISQHGPFRVVQHWRLAAKPDPEAPDPIWRFATRELEWPQIEAPATPQTAALNAWIVTNFVPAQAEVEDASQDTESTLIVNHATAQVVQITESDWLMGHGAAHGNYGSTNITWLVAEQRELQPSDVFAAPGWSAALAAMAVQGFKRDHDGETPFTEGEEFEKLVESPRRWAFSPKGLELMFQPYEAASYAEGEVFIAISWHDLAPWLAKDSKLLAMLRE